MVIKFFWNTIDGATEYKITINFKRGGEGTNVPLTDIGNVTQYTATNNFNPEGNWSVIPYNDAGDAVGCFIWNFYEYVGGPI